MRMGPGKHLKGLTLAEGLVEPEEVRLVLRPNATWARLNEPSSRSSITFMS